MTKQEFLAGLEETLAGMVSQQVFQENMQYYRNYIDGEIQKGRREEDVLNELGSPRLIARTIMDAEDASAEGSLHGSYGEARGSGDYYAGSDQQQGESRNRYGSNGTIPGGFGVFSTGSSGCLWLTLILGVLVICVISVLVRFVYTFPGLVVLGIIFYVVHSRRNRRY